MTEDTTTIAQVIRGRDPLYREIYTNSSQTQLNPFDISILFQRSAEIIPGQPGLIDHATVTFSPQNFKAFLKAASETLSAYEQVYGKLSVPEEVTDSARTAAQIVNLLHMQKAAVAKIKADMNTTPSSTEPPPPSKRSRSASPKKER